VAPGSNKLNAFLSPLLAAWLIGGHHVDLRELPYVAQLFVLQIVPFFVARRLRKWRPAGAARNLALALVIANMTVRDDRVLLALFGAWVILVALAWVAVALFRISARGEGRRPTPSPRPTSPVRQPA
jgi:predicted Na+-dependent transporter